MYFISHVLGKSSANLQPNLVDQVFLNFNVNNRRNVDDSDATKKIVEKIEKKKLKTINLQLPRWDSKREYKIHDYAIVGGQYKNSSENNKVCLATQTSVDRLYWIPYVLKHWLGPVSIAVFVPDVEFEIFKVFMTYLEECYPERLDRVAFHFVYPTNHLPKDKKRWIHIEDCPNANVALKKLLKLRPKSVMKWREKMPYPQNHLRNVARKNCQSDFVFLSDIDIIPSKDSVKKLNRFFSSKDHSLKNKSIYVIPTYELDYKVPFPSNKSELIQLVHEKKAQPFHYKIFIHNQYATNYSHWEANTDDNNEITVSHQVTNMEFFYEPFYVSRDSVPQHSEKFVGYGFTRNTQVNIKSM